VRKPSFDTNAPESWRTSYLYDLQEVFGELLHRGYSYAYGRRFQKTLRMIRRSAAPPARVLDIAAAQGNITLTLAEMGYHVTWNDLRADLEDYVRLKYERGEVQFKPGNAFELGFASEFDIVVITEIIEHVAHPDEFLRKVSRLVKPGGHVVMTTPNGGYFLNRLPRFSECEDPSQFEAIQFKPNGDGHIFLLHEDEIAPLAAGAGLEVREINISTNPLTNGHLKTELALRVLPRSWVEAVEQLTSNLPRPIVRQLHTSMAILFRRLP